MRRRTVHTLAPAKGPHDFPLVAAEDFHALLAGASAGTFSAQPATDKLSLEDVQRAVELLEANGVPRTDRGTYMLAVPDAYREDADEMFGAPFWNAQLRRYLHEVAMRPVRGPVVILHEPEPPKEDP